MLAFVVSCSQKSTQTEGEVCMTIKSEESPVTMSVSSAPQPTEQAPETDTIVVIQETVTVPEAYSKFNLDIIDDDSLTSADNDTIAVDDVIPDSTDSNKYRQAYRTGISFGAVRKGYQNKEKFSEIILQNEQKGDASSAAIMMAGKYFKMLQMFADKTKDEKRLKQAIDGLDNLRGYINEALQSNKDVSTNILLQKISDNAMACRTVYEKCNADYDGQTDKYRALADTISIMQKNLFAE